MFMQFKAGLRDALSLAQQALGLPYNRTRQQVNALKAGFDPARLHAERARVIAAAFGVPAEQIARFAGDFEAHAPEDYPIWIERGESAMSLRDRTTLHCLVRCAQPRLVVETGTAGGASAAVILEQIAQQGGGHLHSIDIEGRHSHHYGDLIPAELRPFWTLHLQTSAPLLPALLADLKPLDMFLHDSKHEVRHMLWEYELAWAALHAGGVLASHDVLTTSAYGDFARKHAGQIRVQGVVGNFGFFVKSASA
jgi:predicted O-methyltransferase YrrM